MIAAFWGYPRISLCTLQFCTVLGQFPHQVLLQGSVHCCLSCSTLYCCLLPYSELQCLFSIVSSCIHHILSYQLKWIPPNIGVCPIFDFELLDMSCTKLIQLWQVIVHNFSSQLGEECDRNGLRLSVDGTTFLLWGEDGSLCPREDNHTKNSTLFSDCPMLTILG